MEAAVESETFHNPTQDYWHPLVFRFERVVIRVGDDGAGRSDVTLRDSLHVP